MMNPCIDCGRHFPGLWYVVPDEAWKAAVGSLDAGELCPWCLDTRLAVAGVEARAQISLDLGHFHALNMGVIHELEALDRRLNQEQREREPCQP